MALNEIPEYGFEHSGPAHTMAYLTPAIGALLGDRLAEGVRVLDVGCGNGWLVNWFIGHGAVGVGIDASEQGIEQARKAFPKGRFERLLADDRVLENLGEEPFDIVVSTEVVEHLYDPRSWARGCMAAVRGGGRFVCTTPYHGWMKNVAVAVMNKFDHHMNPLWDGGHIKFWSPSTLGTLLREAGFVDVRWKGAGRLPPLWKSMVMSGDRPGS